MKQTKPHKIAERIPCRYCEETGNANYRHPTQPPKTCHRCNGLGWVVAKPKPLRRKRKAK